MKLVLLYLLTIFLLHCSSYISCGEIRSQGKESHVCFVLADNKVLSRVFQIIHLDMCPVSLFKLVLESDDQSSCLFISVRSFKYLQVASIAKVYIK